MDNARAFCKRNFGDLVSIQSESEKKFLWKYVRASIHFLMLTVLGGTGGVSLYGKVL